MFFITYDEKGFQITREAKDFLEQLPDEVELGIVSVVGKYRTGKSFFINWALLNRDGHATSPGFDVGPTV